MPPSSSCERASAACLRSPRTTRTSRPDGGYGHAGRPPAEVEEAIADRRELYNEAVNLNNIRVQTFPDLIVARLFEFKQSALLEFTEEQKRDVDVGKLFG